MKGTTCPCRRPGTTPPPRIDQPGVEVDLLTKAPNTVKEQQLSKPTSRDEPEHRYEHAQWPEAQEHLDLVVTYEEKPNPSAKSVDTSMRKQREWEEEGEALPPPSLPLPRPQAAVRCKELTGGGQ